MSVVVTASDGPGWFELIEWVALGLGFASALVIVADIAVLGASTRSCGVLAPRRSIATLSGALRLQKRLQRQARVLCLENEKFCKQHLLEWSVPGSNR
jgi:selenophosphate synthetase-related protein